MIYYILAYIAYCLIIYRIGRWFQITSEGKDKYSYGDVMFILSFSFMPVINIVLIIMFIIDHCKGKKPPTWL